MCEIIWLIFLFVFVFLILIVLFVLFGGFFEEFIEIMICEDVLVVVGFFVFGILVSDILLFIFLSVVCMVVGRWFGIVFGMLVSWFGMMSGLLIGYGLVYVFGLVIVWRFSVERLFEWI